ncbi:MAG TPA: hypothetical protein VKU87_12045, partial [Thermomicrobiaceae bacterium]|nr:hypothetical protein [Thermomicrobiaceae bacterium]
AHVIAGLAGVAMSRRDYATARRQMLAALELRRSINNVGSIAISLTSLGELARREGELAEAKRYLAEGLAYCRDFGDAEHIAWNLYNTGLVAIGQRDSAAAARALAECLSLRVSQGNPVEIANTVAAIAGLARLSSEVATAAELWGAVVAIRREHGAGSSSDEDAEAEREMLRAVHRGLGDSAVAGRLAGGDTIPLSEAVRRAEEFVAGTAKLLAAADEDHQ